MGNTVLLPSPDALLFFIYLQLFIRVQVIEFIEPPLNWKTLIYHLLHKTCNVFRTRLQLERAIRREECHTSTLSVLMWQLLPKCPLETAIKPGGQGKEQQDNT